MKETDDGTKVGVSDVGSIPTTSTKTWADKPERLGQKLDKRPDWYYTPNEWSRSIGWGTVPDERVNWIRRGESKSCKRILTHNINANDDVYFEDYALAA